MTRRVARCFTAAFVIALSGPASAQPSSADRVAAESLFNEARALAAQKKYDEACPKFAASQKLDPAVGTLINLGECYQRKGLLASAWLQYKEAVSLAVSRSDEKRAQSAREKAAALEPKLGKLRIHAAPGVIVERDGTRIDVAMLDTEVPVDAGAHVVDASKEGKKPWHVSVDVKDGETSRVDVPELEDAPVVAKPGAEAPVAAVLPPETNGNGQRIAGLVVGGVGIVGLGLGTVFALSAQSKWSSVTDKCPDKVCPDAATRDSVAQSRDDASKAATLGTVGFIAGGALVATGAVLFFMAPKSASKERALRVTPLVGRDVAGLRFEGTLP
jgi:hypothetical protein